MNYKAIFISDVHLGIKYTQNEKLLKFLQKNSCEELYLVGDIIDEWALKRRCGFKGAHFLVILELLKLSKTTKIFYLAGNHDEFLRDYLPLNYIENIEIINEICYNTMDNKKYLVIHGDQFDQIIIHKKWISILGDISYNFILGVNHYLQFFRKTAGYKNYWSLSKFLKDFTKKLVNTKHNFDEIVHTHIRENNFDGIICGHVHKPQIRKIHDIDYINCGDWIENCTAIVETLTGEWKIIKHEDTI